MKNKFSKAKPQAFYFRRKIEEKKIERNKMTF